MMRYIISICISIAVIILGAVLSAYEFFEYSISDSFADSNFSTKTATYNVKLEDGNNLIDADFSKEPTISYDNSIAEGNIVIKVTYYDELMGVENFAVKNDNENVIYINVDRNDDWGTVKKLFDITIDGLKNKHVYDYYLASRPEVKVYMNEVDKDNVEVRK